MSAFRRQDQQTSTCVYFQFMSDTDTLMIPLVYGWREIRKLMVLIIQRELCKLIISKELFLIIIEISIIIIFN